MYFDHRDIAANTRKWYESYDEKTMTIRISVACDDEVYEELKECLGEEAHKLIDEDGCVSLPMYFVVCSTYNGKGKHVNPSIDAHGITAEEWDRDWSYEDREMYLDGFYDVSCYECGGKRVVPEIDSKGYCFTTAMKEIKELIDDNIAEEASYTRMCMMERAMGA